MRPLLGPAIIPLGPDSIPSEHGRPRLHGLLDRQAEAPSQTLGSLAQGVALVLRDERPLGRVLGIPHASLVALGADPEAVTGCGAGNDVLARADRAQLVPRVKLGGEYARPEFAFFLPCHSYHSRFASSSRQSATPTQPRICMAFMNTRAWPRLGKGCRVCLHLFERRRPVELGRLVARVRGVGRAGRAALFAFLDLA